MKIDMSFKVTALCKVYNTTQETDVDNMELTLELDVKQAMNFLFKFTPNTFDYQQFKVHLSHDDHHVLTVISFRVKNNLYIVTNKDKFLSEVLEGYERIRMMEKLSSIIEFSGFTSSTPDSDEVLEEEDFESNIDII